MPPWIFCCKTKKSNRSNNANFNRSIQGGLTHQKGDRQCNWDTGWLDSRHMGHRQLGWMGFNIWWSTRDTCRCIQGIIGLLVTYMWIVDTRWSLGHLPPLQQLTLVNHPNPKFRVTLQILQDIWAIYSCQCVQLSVPGEQTFFWWNILKLTSKYIWVNTINRWAVDKMNHQNEKNSSLLI